MMGKNQKIAVTALALLLLLTAIGGTLALIMDRTKAVENTFKSSHVDTEVTEEFDGRFKTNVNATNTGNIDAYIRIRLVTYRVNDNGDRIGGTATIPDFTPGNGWVKNGEYYYYTQPVAPDHKPATELIDKIELVEYDDLDGGRQVIEVMAEAIQAQGGSAVNGLYTPAVTQAWGIKVDGNGNLVVE